MVYCKRRLQGNKAAALLITETSNWQKRCWAEPAGPSLLLQISTFPTMIEYVPLPMREKSRLCFEIHSFPVLRDPDQKHIGEGSLLSMMPNTIIDWSVFPLYFVCAGSHNYFNLELIRCLHLNPLLNSCCWSHLNFLHSWNQTSALRSVCLCVIIHVIIENCTSKNNIYLLKVKLKNETGKSSFYTFKARILNSKS